MNICINLGIWTFIKARLRERSTRRALCVIVLAVAGIAQVPENWAAEHHAAWFVLIGLIAGQLVHIIDPDDFPPTASA